MTRMRARTARRCFGITRAARERVVRLRAHEVLVRALAGRAQLAEFEAKLKYISENVVHDASNVVFGSAAGAGSSTYHIYRRSRRNEEDRWRRVGVAV